MTAYPSKSDWEQMLQSEKREVARTEPTADEVDGSQWRLVSWDGSCTPLDIASENHEPDEKSPEPPPLEQTFIDAEEKPPTVEAAPNKTKERLPLQETLFAQAPLSETPPAQSSLSQKSLDLEATLSNNSAEAPFKKSGGGVAMDDKPAKYYRGVDASLGQVIQAWPSLPENLKKAVLAVVNSVKS